MIMDDNGGQMIFGDLGGLKLPDICLTGEEKPDKTSPRKLVPTGDRTRARCVTGAHAAACPTTVDPQPPRNEPHLSARLYLPPLPILDEHTSHYAHLQSNKQRVDLCVFTMHISFPTDDSVDT